MKQIFPEFSKKRYFHHFGSTAACRGCKNLSRWELSNTRSEDWADKQGRGRAEPLPAWAIDQQDKFGPRFSSRGPYVFAVSQTRPNTRCLLLTASESSADDRPCPPLNHRLIPRDESAARRSRSATTLSSRTWKSARRADPAYVPRINSTATSLDDEPWIVALDAEEKKMRRNIIRSGV